MKVLKLADQERLRVLPGLPCPEQLQSEGTRKRLFIGLTCLTSFLVCAFLSILWVIPTIGLVNIHPLAPLIFGGFILICLGLVCWATCGLVFNLALGKSVPFFKPISGLTIRLFLPLMTLLARLLGISKEKVRSSFIRVNNELVSGSGKKYQRKDMLLLLPHCLQNSRCKFMLTYSVSNCKRCGDCPVDGLLSLSERYGINMSIATGGTIARRIIVQTKPRLILAVACERDLSSGIQDAYPIPVYGLLNDRPHGPCLDTQVSLEHLEQAILFFSLPLPGKAN